MTTRSLLTAMAITCMGMAPAFAQTPSQPTKPARPTTPSTPTTDVKPGMGQPPSMDKMMEQMEKMSKPGPNHQLLNGMVGEWTCECKFWMDPTGGSPTESKGTASNSWTLDKRFVKQEFNGTFAMPGMPEMPFHGLGYTGFDNQKEKFVSTWMDSMATGIMYSEGAYDAGSKTFTFTANMTDCMTNQPCTMREVVKVIDDNTHTFTMYNTPQGGQEMKVGEITYHRKGSMKPMDTNDKPKMDKPMDSKPMTPGTPSTPKTPGRSGGGN